MSVSTATQQGVKLHIFSLPHKALVIRDARREKERERESSAAVLVTINGLFLYAFYCGFLPPTSLYDAWLIQVNTICLQCIFFTIEVE